MLKMEFTRETSDNFRMVGEKFQGILTMEILSLPIPLFSDEKLIKHEFPEHAMNGHTYTTKHPNTKTDYTAKNHHNKRNIETLRS